MKELEQLRDKIEQTGQDFGTYVKGWQNSRYTNYWDYIQLETLLSLQRPRTEIADEPIFIIYHQITELYFKLARIELDAIAGGQCTAETFIERVHRINRYFGALRDSFGVMEKGMNKDEFLAFRDALAPASGFQSVQYRIIELACAPVLNIVSEPHRGSVASAPVEQQMEYIYWKSGANVESTGKPAFTAVQFIEKYWSSLLEHAKHYESRNLWAQFLKLKAEGMPQEQVAEIEDALRLLDLNVNVYWPLQHYKTAVRYLAQGDNAVAATGGTNWRKYLPPRFQRRIFYPELWTEDQRENWGRSWVHELLEALKKGHE